MRQKILVITLVSALSSPLIAETLIGRIVSISDGDTLTLLDENNSRHRIRLAGIDAPEKNQDFGQKSKTSLSALAFGQSAKADCRKKDRYQSKRPATTVLLAMQ